MVNRFANLCGRCIESNAITGADNEVSNSMAHSPEGDFPATCLVWTEIPNYSGKVCDQAVLGGCTNDMNGGLGTLILISGPKHSFTA